MTRRLQCILAAAAGALALVLAGAAASRLAARETDQDSTPVYEVRSYHIDPAHLEDYRTWITGHGLPYLRRELDVVGFWIDVGIEPDIRGAVLDPTATPNVTWIVRWPSKADRDERMPQVLGSPEWQEIFARLPGGGANYLRIEVRFLSGL